MALAEGLQRELERVRSELLRLPIGSKRRMLFVRDEERLVGAVRTEIMDEPLATDELAALGEISQVLAGTYDAKQPLDLKEAIRRVTALRALYPRAAAVLPRELVRREAAMRALVPHEKPTRTQLVIGGT